MSRRSIITFVVLAVLLAALWAFPPIVFANPATNEAIWLANLEFVLLLLGLIGLVVAVVRGGLQRAAVCVELGVFVIGSAAALFLGFLVFGNNSNDRFLPLIVLPPLIALPGVVVVVIGLVLPGNRGALARPAASGLAAAIVVALWVLLRGSRDWLLAPYGFDEIALIVVLGVALGTIRPASRG